MWTMSRAILTGAVSKCGPAGLCVVALTAMLTTSSVGAELDGVAGDGDREEHAAVRQWAERALLRSIPRSGVSADRGPSDAIPFSFIYGGRPSSELLHGSKRSTSSEPAANGRQQHRITWTDEKTGLEVTCEATVFSDFPAVEWLLRLKNTSNQPTPIIEKILPLDVSVGLDEQEAVTVHHAEGSTMTANDYRTIDAAVQPGREVSLPSEGRLSQTALPYFNVQWHDGGLVGAIGWTGQWALRVARSGQHELAIEAGQQRTHFRLLPGESIRTPRILLLWWRGADRLRGHNLLRRLLIAHYVPRVEGKLVMPPMSQNAWFVFNIGNDTTEQNQLEMIGKMRAMGLEAYWLDAGWFEGGWPDGVGSWVPRKDHFPRGLRPIGDAAHKAGLKFILWFEPERVFRGSRIETEHPQWLLKAKGGGDGNHLFNLGNPEARKWMTDYLSRCISDWGVDVYRQDRNHYPHLYWQTADAPDRVGITEIRHVEGLYAMWDALLKAHAGLVIDNANWRATGPDLEVLMRSAGSWTSSEAGNGGENPLYNQQQLMGLSFYVPIHASLLFKTDPYTVRSVARFGTSLSMDTRGPAFSPDEMKLASHEIKSLRELYLGDYYPLIPADLDERQWCGWQFDRPDLGEGFAMCFRRSQSPKSAREVALRALEPNARYEVTFAETYVAKEKRLMTGGELAKLNVQIGQRPGSVLIRYRRMPQSVANGERGKP